HAVQITVIEGETRPLKLLIVGKYLLGACHIFSFAFQVNGVGTQVDGDVQAVFQDMQVFIPGAEQGLDIRADLDTFLHFRKWTRLLRSANSRNYLPFRRKQSSLCEVD